MPIAHILGYIVFLQYTVRMRPEEGSSGEPQSADEAEKGAVEEEHGHRVVEHPQHKYRVDTIRRAREEQ